MNMPTDYHQYQHCVTIFLNILKKNQKFRKMVMHRFMLKKDDDVG